MPVTIRFASPVHTGHIEEIKQERLSLANTKKIEDKLERKKVKRAARKKAAPKAKRTTPRGSNKKKLKKATRGQSKR
jgi:hypothetical protein